MNLHAVFHRCLDHLVKVKDEFNIVRAKLGKMLEVLTTTIQYLHLGLDFCMPSFWHIFIIIMPKM